MGYYRRRKKRAKMGVLVLLILSLAILLVSCVASADSMWLPRLFGTDVRIYRSEPVQAVHESNGELAAELSQTVLMLTSGSVTLQAFHTPARAVSLYRDEILNSMMIGNSAVYVGNTALSGSVQKNYPHLSASVMIPASDFENTVAEHLGASTVSNGDGERYAYLSKSACYTTPVLGSMSEVALQVLSLEETARTYQMQFLLTDSEGTTAAYQALFVKRENGAPYLKALECA